MTTDDGQIRRAEAEAHRTRLPAELAPRLDAANRAGDLACRQIDRTAHTLDAERKAVETLFLQGLPGWPNR